MKPNSFGSSSTSRQKAVGSRQPCPAWSVLLTAYCLLLTVVGAGCESFERKFIRKSKRKTTISPIIRFEDYTKAVTPLDRYRKHSLLFDYWNDDLMSALQRRPFNAKRCRRASTEALAELEILKSLLTEDVAVRLEPLVQERARIHRQLVTGTFSANQADATGRILETQKRRFNREFFWRDVEDRLKRSTAETPSADRSDRGPQTPDPLPSPAGQSE